MLAFASEPENAEADTAAVVPTMPPDHRLYGLEITDAGTGKPEGLKHSTGKLALHRVSPTYGLQTFAPPVHPTVTVPFVALTARRSHVMPFAVAGRGLHFPLVGEAMSMPSSGVSTRWKISTSSR